jgi:hypothetical protein
VSVEALAVIGAATGIVGALTGVASLGWQVVTHRRSGRLVDVTCSYSIPVYGPPGAQELGDNHQVAIKVTNAGGAPVTVTNYGVSMDGGKGDENLFVTTPVPWSRRVPCAVEPGGEPAELLVPVDELRHMHQQKGIPFSRMRPWVDLGDGRRVYSNRTVPLK